MHEHWQDIVLSSCILGFNIALIPTLFSKRHNPHVGTGIMTAAFQVVAFFVYINLHLWYSAAMGMLNAVLWAIIVTQSLTAPKATKRKR
jgi:hypothetical protein